MRLTLLATLLLAAPPVFAGETQAQVQPQEAAAEEAAPRPHVRVLRDPYEISSYYRADGAGPAAPRFEDEDGRVTIDPRSISSFYRSSEPSGPAHGYGYGYYGYGFQSGYGYAPRPSQFRSFHGVRGVVGNRAFAPRCR